MLLRKGVQGDRPRHWDADEVAVTKGKRLQVAAVSGACSSGSASENSESFADGRGRTTFFQTLFPLG